MLVKNWMSKDVVTIDENDSMDKAARALKEHKVSMLPVMKKDRLVGIVTDRDIKEASASDATTLDIHEILYLVSKIKVSEIMTKDPVTVAVDATVEEAADILLEKRISGAPVLDPEGKVVGVISKADLFKVLISLTGVGKRGIQFAFEVEDRPGSIKEVSDIVRKYGGRMVSILGTYEQGVPPGYRRVYIRMYEIDRDKLQALKEEMGKQVKLLYMVDHRENKREIY